MEDGKGAYRVLVGRPDGEVKTATDEVKMVTACRVLDHLNAHIRGLCILSIHNHN
jgi:hypothetical protein